VIVVVTGMYDNFSGDEGGFFFFFFFFLFFCFLRLSESFSHLVIRIYRRSAACSRCCSELIIFLGRGEFRAALTEILKAASLRRTEEGHVVRSVSRMRSPVDFPKQPPTCFSSPRQRRRCRRCRA